ncbi:MAG: UDP-3-O-acyl-N-acetylglucosamine deacetylase [Synergistaceae bacterium]|jgi:UDP-3-O-[3-hydroxymyristoyl] N-acetylglucosamine deacetylase|nr:UDP-3-O-acyl-N-acetylglucosamine deacetylase [Synergistaceae bacterium]
MKYRRLTQSLFRRGKGLHSGLECALSIEPSDEALSLEIEGQRFFLSRLALSGTGRGTDLIFPDGKRVRTCEHVLSALVGLGVWQAKLTLTGPGIAGPESGLEMPGLDGCALDLAREVLEKSIPVQGPAPFRLSCPIRAGDSSRFVIALPSPSFRITYVIDYDAAPIGTQIFDYLAPDAGADADSERSGGDYLREIAPARTFVLRKDVEALRAAGLALGGSLDNAILVDEGGVETAGGLRFRDEFARHKVLDLLGDLANLGRPLAAHLVAVRAGHAQHLQMVEKLRAVSARSTRVR